MNEAIKKLYKFNKKSLQAINKTFGIDFNKPLEAITIEGNTTINQILKKVDHDALIIVLTNTPGYYGQEYRAATIDKYGKVKVGEDKYSHYSFIWHSGIDNYYSIGNFREAIKDTSGNTIVIAQQKCYLCESKKIPFDYSNRYKLIPAKYENEYYTYHSRDNGRYISKLNLKDLNSNGRTIEYHTDHYYSETENISDIIDKSGYIVENSRQELKRKATALRQEREKALYTATNNTERIEALGNLLKSKKDMIAADLKAATTFEQVKAIASKLEAWNDGLTKAYMLYEDLKKDDEAKAFKSIESFEAGFTRLTELLNSI